MCCYLFSHSSRHSCQSKRYRESLSLQYWTWILDRITISTSTTMVSITILQKFREYISHFVLTNETISLIQRYTNYLSKRSNSKEYCLSHNSMLDVTGDHPLFTKCGSVANLLHFRRANRFYASRYSFVSKGLAPLFLPTFFILGGIGLGPFCRSSCHCHPNRVTMDYGINEAV